MPSFVQKARDNSSVIVNSKLESLINKTNGVDDLSSKFSAVNYTSSMSTMKNDFG